LPTPMSPVTTTTPCSAANQPRSLANVWRDCCCRSDSDPQSTETGRSDPGRLIHGEQYARAATMTFPGGTG
jgi:hypothetical protein